MRVWMTRFGLSWPWKKADKASAPPSDALTAQQLRDTLQFTNGYLLAMSQGVSELEERLLTQAAEQMLTQLEETILKRAESLGHQQVRDTNALLKKREEFTAKLAAATTDADRAKYTYYLEALKWMLPTNGH